MAQKPEMVEQEEKTNEVKTPEARQLRNLKEVRGEVTPTSALNLGQEKGTRTPFLRPRLLSFQLTLSTWLSHGSGGEELWRDNTLHLRAEASPGW